MTKIKMTKSKIKFVETGKIELRLRVPGVSPENIKFIVRDTRRTLENCARLNQLNEFSETMIVEFKEVPVVPEEVPKYHWHQLEDRTEAN